MKTLKRNKTKFYYALYKTKELIKDEYGNFSGEYKRGYGNPQPYYANISPTKGETLTRQFGETLDYDKVIVMDNNIPKIDEYTILWVDTLPEINADGDTDTPYDYEIKRIAKSLNSVSLAIHKVNVS